MLGMSTVFLPFSDTMEKCAVACGWLHSAVIKARWQIMFFPLVQAEQRRTSVWPCWHEGHAPCEPSGHRPPEHLPHAALDCVSPPDCRGEAGRDERRR